MKPALFSNPLAAAPPGPGRGPLLATPLLMLPTTLWAEVATPASADPLAGMMLRTSLGLAVVLALIFALAWVARRWSGSLRAHGQVPLQVVGSLALGPRERIVVVAVEDRWLVLGVNPGGIRTLDQMPARADALPATSHRQSTGSRQSATGSGAFMDRLQSALRRRDP